MLKILQIFTCLSLFVIFLLSYLDRQNKVVELKLKIPKEQKEIERLVQENQVLRAKIDHLEHPLELMSFLKKKEFRHLSFYLDKDIVCLKAAPQIKKEKKIEQVCRPAPSISIASGVSHR